MQGYSSINLVTIFTISAKLPPPLQQFQWLRPTSELGRAKISENKMEVGLEARTGSEFRELGSLSRHRWCATFDCDLREERSGSKGTFWRD
jgi:hypothetical protein